MPEGIESVVVGHTGTEISGQAPVPSIDPIQAELEVEVIEHDQNTLNEVAEWNQYSWPRDNAEVDKFLSSKGVVVVESEEQMESFTRMYCEVYQGYPWFQDFDAEERAKNFKELAAKGVRFLTWGSEEKGFAFAAYVSGKKGDILDLFSREYLGILTTPSKKAKMEAKQIIDEGGTATWKNELVKDSEGNYVLEDVESIPMTNAAVNRDIVLKKLRNQFADLQENDDMGYILDIGANGAGRIRGSILLFLKMSNELRGCKQILAQTVAGGEMDALSVGKFGEIGIDRYQDHIVFTVWQDALQSFAKRTYGRFNKEANLIKLSNE